MSLIQRLSERLTRHPKRIVFPEGADPRIIQAARKFASMRLGVPILLGDRSQIRERAQRLDIDLTGIRIVEPEHSEERAGFMEKMQGLSRFQNLNEFEISEYVSNKNYFATLMLATGQADAMVGGATQTASSVIRPVLQLIPLQQGVHSVSSMLLLDTDESHLGYNGVLFLADCGVIPDPTSQQLAEIAVVTATLAHHLTNETPRVAMLSYSSKSNSSNATIMKMQAATQLAHELARQGDNKIEIDGELQVDAALSAVTAEQKGISGSVAGKANVLVFPDLASGNIASKLLHVIAGTPIYGPILTGLRKPVAEISRGASAHDILGAAVLVGCQAVDHRFLYGQEHQVINPDEFK